MKLALIGYGKMGHLIGQAAESRGHTVVCTVDLFAKDATCITSDPHEMVQSIKASLADGVIEFTHPASVMSNIMAVVPTGIPLVVGTTGWKDRLPEVEELVRLNRSSLLHASNFSIGVNLFYRMVSEAARLMSAFEEYDVALFEAHHNQKADSPSGTALDLARRILANTPRKDKLVVDTFDRKPEPGELHLASVRLGAVPGTHTVWFDSAADTIELKHTARNREGFAMGAVRAMEWLVAPDAAGRQKTGVFTVDEVYSTL